jgi:hypothetical protein
MGFPTDPNNYRPISILPILSNILERIIYERILNHLNDNDCIFKYQSGFRFNDGTNRALLSLIEKWQNEINFKRIIAVFFADFKKGFDSVWHKALLKKIESYGIYGDLLDLLTSYLSDRYHCVKIDGQISEFLEIESGVLQGSVLGPLLFLIFINDIYKVCPGSEESCRLYADDLLYWISDVKKDSLHQRLQSGCDAIQEWSDKWHLPINVKKCSTMIISLDKKKKFDSSNYTLYNENVICEKVHKHLGLNISHDISWTHHCNYVINKCNKLIGLMYQMRGLPENALKKFYLCIIRPNIEYVCEVYGNPGKTNLFNIEGIQKRALRCISKTNFGQTSIDVSYEALLSYYNMCTVEDRLKFYRMKNVYQIVNNYSPEHMNDLMPSTCFHRHNMNLRNRSDFDVPKPRTETFKHSFSYTSIIEWNNLDFDVKNAKSINEFKVLYKKRYL